MLLNQVHEEEEEEEVVVREISRDLDDGFI